MEVLHCNHLLSSNLKRDRFHSADDQLSKILLASLSGSSTMRHTLSKIIV